ncbi:MAG TPA: hypothetical protein VKA48_13165 [Gammaproteobacteria bacterium]|nr:hypothetical protein [Gammaproteobacteria bacterium]
MLKNPRLWEARRHAARELAILRQELEDLATHEDPITREHYEDAERDYREAEAILISLREGTPNQQFKAADRALEL